MGYIKEPDNIDLNVGPMPLSTEDRLTVSAIIAQFKSTGEIPTGTGVAKVTKTVRPGRVKKSAATKSAEILHRSKTSKQ